jgi:hypothetical protein
MGTIKGLAASSTIGAVSLGERPLLDSREICPAVLGADLLAE